MTFGSLFSGVGGLDLALEHFGHTPLWQAEKDPFARRVLARHWPNVPCFDDVKEIDGKFPAPDVICGGFPCQDISNAGKRVGIDGERSGLWSEFARIVRELRPRIVLVENVAALSVRGLDRVLGDLAALGFDAEWDVFRASDVGAPHLRARIFILAYAERDALRLESGWLGGTCRTDEAEPRSDGDDGTLADADEHGLSIERRAECERSQAGVEDARGDVPDRCDRAGTMADAGREARGQAPRVAVGGDGAGADRQRAQESGRRYRGNRDHWAVESAVGRVAHGVPGRVDRLRCLGNAVVWQQAALAIEALTWRIIADLPLATAPVPFATGGAT